MTTIRLLWLFLGGGWAIIEVVIALRTRVAFSTPDKLEFRSEKLIWMVVVTAMLISLWLKQMQWWPLPISYLGRQLIAVPMFMAGLALRCYAVFVLGQFFSTTVVMHDGHVLIEQGPYAYIRHPAYAGLLCSFFAAGLAMGDALALAMLLCPIVYVFIQRIRFEEKWLSARLGAPYSEYCLRTKKLLPWLY